MPTNEKTVVNLRGSEAYARFLDRLERAVRDRGVNLPTGRAALADYALTVLGLQHGLKAPPRVKAPHRPRKTAP